MTSRPPFSTVTTRSSARSKKTADDEADGWEAELDRKKTKEEDRGRELDQPRPSPVFTNAAQPSSAMASSHPQPAISAPALASRSTVQPSSSSSSFPSTSSFASPSTSSSFSPASPSSPTSPISPSSPSLPSQPPSFTRPSSSSSSSYRSSFGRPHGATASALTHATTSLASELSHLEEHPAFLSLTASLRSLPFLSPLAARLGMGELPLATLLTVSAALSFLWGVGASGALELLLFLYPAYLSYHALEGIGGQEAGEGGDEGMEVGVGEEEGEGEEGEEPEVRRWLLYWTLHALLWMVGGVTDRLWADRGGWVYWMVKASLSVVLLVRRWEVCEAVWGWVVGPVWRVNEEAVEGGVEWVVEGVGRLWVECRQVVKEGVVWWISGGGGRGGVGASGPSPTSSVLRKARQRRAVK